MTFAGTAITRVGLNPRHKDNAPSFRAILRSPSIVEVNVRFWVSSTAHSAADAVPLFPAKQNWALSPNQNTSRQQAVTPSSGGNRLKEVVYWEKFELPLDKEAGLCDCKRTRTTSRGVTDTSNQAQTIIDVGVPRIIPRRDVRMLPQVAAVIFWTAEMSAVPPPLGAPMLPVRSFVVGCLSSLGSSDTSSCLIANGCSSLALDG